MARSVIDPITRIEGHMRVDMEVENGHVKEAWVSGGSFRGMEKVVEHRKPEDAAQIVQRICGVCPVSHTHCSTIAAEDAYGIKIPNRARIIRNLIEGAQFLHSHILWLYNLAALDYVNPINAVTGNADVKLAYDIAQGGAVPQLGAALPAQLSTNSDLYAVAERLKKFAATGQLSIFSGNWFEAKDLDGGNAYHLTPELDLILTSHYLEALKYQARSSEIAALLGGKMPHVMTIIPGGTSFVPTAQKLDDLWAMVNEVYDWVETTLIPDTLALAVAYPEGLTWGGGCGRFGAWGVFERGSLSYNDRYMPAGVIMDAKNVLDVQDLDRNKISEYVGSSWYKGSDTYPAPDYTTDPEFTSYPEELTGLKNGERYTWCKAPSYDGKALECTSLSRVLVAYARGHQPEYAKKNAWMVEQVDKFLGLIEPVAQSVGKTSLEAAVSMLGRTAIRQLETLYIAQLMKDWTAELIEAVKGGSLEDLAGMEGMSATEFASDDVESYFKKPSGVKGENNTGWGFWEAPRGALYHTEEVDPGSGNIKGYQIIIPTTWNLAPVNQNKEHGPIEQALEGCPVFDGSEKDLEMPINALRLVHSYDPCVSCAVHVTDVKTGKKFSTVTNPWGVK